MSNPLFNSMMPNGGNPANQNPLMAFMSSLSQLKKTFNGDPNQAIQQMLNSGQISQEKYNEFAQQASQIQAMMETFNVKI